MTQYYKKVSLDLTNIDITKLKGEFYESFGNTFHHYRIKDIDYLMSLVNQQIRFLLQPDWVFIAEITDSGVNPHVDTCMTVLNYYIDSQNSITCFFKPMSDTTATMVKSKYDDSDKESRVFEYNLKELELRASFKALDHEAYLLDTHSIHLVNKQKRNLPRRMIRWLWMDKPLQVVERFIQKV